MPNSPKPTPLPGLGGQRRLNPLISGAPRAVPVRDRLLSTGAPLASGSWIAEDETTGPATENPWAREDEPLRASLKTEAGRIIGSREHVQLVSLVSNAEAYALTPELTTEVAHTVDERAISIERNLDLIEIPANGVWIEWRERARHMGREAEKESVHPVRSGVLVVPAPDDPDRLHFLTAWRTSSGASMHGYAGVAVSRHALAVDAWHARNRFSTVPLESQARMLTLAQSYFPDGLLGELKTLAGYEAEGNPDGDMESVVDRAMHRSRMDALSDIPFVLGALLMLREGVTLRSAGPDDETVLDVAPLNGLAAFLTRLGVKFDFGFFRRGRNSAARVDYRPLRRPPAKKTA